MKIRKFVYLIPLVIGMVAGIFIKGFAGGFIAGSCAMIILFATVGKVLAAKAMNSINNKITIRHEFHDDFGSK